MFLDLCMNQNDNTERFGITIENTHPSPSPAVPPSNQISPAASSPEEVKASASSADSNNAEININNSGETEGDTEGEGKSEREVNRLTEGVEEEMEMTEVQTTPEAVEAVTAGSDVHEKDHEEEKEREGKGKGGNRVALEAPDLQAMDPVSGQPPSVNHPENSLLCVYVYVCVCLSLSFALYMDLIHTLCIYIV